MCVGIFIRLIMINIDKLCSVKIAEIYFLANNIFREVFCPYLLNTQRLQSIFVLISLIVVRLKVCLICIPLIISEVEYIYNV